MDREDGRLTIEINWVVGQEDSMVFINGMLLMPFEYHIEKDIYNGSRLRLQEGVVNSIGSGSFNLQIFADGELYSMEIGCAMGGRIITDYSPGQKMANIKKK
jgi:hypothetical protein